MNKSSAILLLAVLFSAGFIFHQLSFTRPIVLAITDLFLFLSNTLVLYFLFKERFSKSLVIWSVMVFLVTFLIEFAGVETGSIFGSYHYGDTMKLQLGNVPLIIAVNWTVLILATYSIALKLTKSYFFSPVISSVLIVIFDFFLEPVAMQLDYWQWKGDIVPVQNYIAWFFISLVFSSLLSIFKINPDSKILRYFFLIQLGFFLLFWLF